MHHNKTNDDPLINEDSYDHSELGNANPDCNFLVNNRHKLFAHITMNVLSMSHINTQTYSHYYKKKHNY